jgi:hypothetical protein
MLNRIFWFTTAASCAAVWLLRLHIHALDQWLQQMDYSVALADNKMLPVPGGYLLPALAAGILTRIFRVHARISDWLGLRECFDLDVIITELAAKCDIDLSGISRTQLVGNRHRIMRQAFYPFVSGPKPHIDPQLIEQALDAWSWFWIGIEATFVLVATGFGLVAAGVYRAGLEILSGTLLAAAIALPTMHRQCRRYAVAQVRAILADPQRAAIVRRSIADLHRPPAANRQAA